MAMPRYLIVLGIFALVIVAMGLIGEVRGSWFWSAATGISIVVWLTFSAVFEQTTMADIVNGRLPRSIERWLLTPTPGYATSSVLMSSLDPGRPLWRSRDGWGRWRAEHHSATDGHESARCLP